MFDRTIVNQSDTEYVPYVKEVNIHKAPTDKSIELLNEFKEKALQETVKIYKTKNCLFDLVIRQIQNPVTMERVLVYHLTINGKDFDVVKKINDLEEINPQFIVKTTREVVEECLLDTIQNKFITQVRNILSK